MRSAAGFRSQKSRPGCWLLFCLVLSQVSSIQEAVASPSLQVRVTCIADYVLVEYSEHRIRYTGNSSGDVHTASASERALDRFNEVVVPVATEVTVTVSSIHPVTPWWRSFLGLGRFAIPHRLAKKSIRLGELRSLWFKLPESCGQVEPDGLLKISGYSRLEFARWLEAREEQDRFPADLSPRQLMKWGHDIYVRRCAACHGRDGEGADLFPRLQSNAVTLGPLAPYLRSIYFGQPGSPMKPFGEVLNATEFAALMTYQRNAWGHNSGDVIQPALVAALLQTVAPR